MSEYLTVWQRFCVWFCNRFCNRWLDMAYSSGRASAFNDCAPGYQGFFPAHALQSNLAETDKWRLDLDCFNRLHLCRRGQPVAWVATAGIGMELFRAVADPPEQRIMSVLAQEFNDNESRRALLRSILAQHTPRTEATATAELLRTTAETAPTGKGETE